MSAVARELDAGSGYVVVPDVVGSSDRDRLRTAIDEAVAAEWDDPRFPDGRWRGRVLFCPSYGGAFLELLEHARLFEPVDDAMDGPSIVYTMTTSCLPPKGANTTGGFHVDLDRIVPGYLLGVGVMVAIDDFTVDNGAPEVLPGSQHRAQPPTATDDHELVGLEAPAGSVIYLHPHLWHRSTTNRTEAWRRNLLLLMVRPWMKQRFDPSTMCPKDDPHLASATVRARLGLTTRPPRSYDEFAENGRSGNHW